MPQVLRWHIYSNAGELATWGAREILQIGRDAIKRAGRFQIVLTGGDTPRRVYQELADAKSDWSRWHVYFGDERCRPVGDAQRNDRMARDAWLDRVPIPPSQVHSMPGELGPEEAAQCYAQIVEPIERFDLVLLGLGGDGHIASLFPGRDEVLATAPTVGVRRSPKPPPERVSLSAGRLSRTHRMLFLIAGASKRDAVAAWRRGEVLPVASVDPFSGIDVLLDRDAWPDRFV